MASASERRSQRELAEARAAGNAPPAVDVKTGAMINPHNPEFITKKPWYLAEGDGSGQGPTLDHQADQRREEDKRGISLGEADRLVREERERVQRKLERQRLRDKSKKKGNEGDDLFELGMFCEALRKGRKPYLIVQIVKVYGRGRSFDLKHEDGYIERNVRPWGDARRGSGGLPRMRVTRMGSRAVAPAKSSGKVTYDSKRDAYHGVEVEGHTKKMEDRYLEREALRKERRQVEKARREEEEEEAAEERAAGRPAGGDAPAAPEEEDDRPSDADSDSDSDSDADAGFSSDEDEVFQGDGDATLFTSRLARQGGVGGAQMKVTARNLRIREDTAKYLRNLDPNSAYYDPKSRSMRDNPYAHDPREAAENLGFAGDNFSRISGDAVGLAETQLFAWDAEQQLGREGVVHPQADPSRAELTRKKAESRGATAKERKRRAVLERYGGAEYLDATTAGGGAATATTAAAAAPKETPEERATRFGIAHAEPEYGRDGRPAGAAAATHTRRAPVPCKYDEDVHPHGHAAVWGSYFHRGAFRWGFADDHSLLRASYGTGPNGRAANDEANELRYGSGDAGTALLATARKMLEAIPAGGGGGGAAAPHERSRLYGEAADQRREFDEKKLQAAIQRQEEREAAAGTREKSKRKYNALAGEEEVTEEDMEAYRLRKSRGSAEDPMAKLGGELLEYKPC